MIHAAKEWARGVESDPARKRGFAIWSIVAIVGLFVIGVGLYSTLSEDNTDISAKSAVVEKKPREPRSSPTDYGKLVAIGFLVLVGAAFIAVVMAIATWIGHQQHRNAQRVFGFDEYGRPVQIHPQKSRSWLFFWWSDDD